MARWNAPPLPVRWDVRARAAFVGRRRELGVVADSWRAAARGVRQVVFVGGEPGAGKSRLVSEAAIAMHDQGAAVLLGSCVSNLGAPYQPFVEPIEKLAAAIAAGQLISDGAESDSAAQHSLLRTVVGAVEHAPEEQFTRQLFRACTDAVLAAARARPMVLVLEDLQWAGGTSLQMLRYLVQHSAESRMLILATHRTAPTDRSADFGSVLGQLYRLHGVRRIDLDGLAADDIADYLVKEMRAKPRTAQNTARVLRGQTGGNPFVLQEVLRDLSARGGLSALGSIDMRAPESVLDTMRHRLAGLPISQRRTVELAAVIGEEFAVDLLAAVVQDGSDGADDGAVLTFACLDAAAALGVIEVGHDAVATSRFPHALARQAVLDLMSEYQRASDNARVASVLELQFPAADLRTQRLAHHYASAHTLGHGVKAVQYLAQAAEAAQSGLAHDEAARLFERAAALAGEPIRRDELRLDAARSLLRSGKFGRAREVDELVATTSRGWLRLRASVGFEAASWRTGQPGESSVQLLTSALAGVEPDSRHPTYVRAIAALGRAHAFSGNVVESRACDTRALELARDTGDERLIATVLQIGLQTVLTPRNLVAKQERGTELTRLCERVGDLRHLGPAAFYRAAASYVRGEPAQVTAAHADLTRATRSTGQPFWEWVEMCVTFGIQFIRADFDEAMRTVALANELAGSFDGAGGTDGSSGLQSFMVRRETGRLEAIRDLITGDEDPTAQWAPGLLALYRELGLRDAARRVLEYLITRDLPRHQGSSTWPAVLAFLCESATWLEHRSAARLLFPMVTGYAGLNLMGGEFLASFGSADRQLGELASVLGNPAAERHFEAALDMDNRMGSPLHVATTLAAHAAHLNRTRERSGRLVEMSGQARALAKKHGLVRVLRLLDAIEEDSLRHTRLPAGLTAREADVLCLLGNGLSNKLIAERLVISDNTAANHVRSILTKIGAANRTQAAIYAASHGLLDERMSHNDGGSTGNRMT
jgi:DNA-binding CsgD family transcriptional regulator